MTDAFNPMPDQLQQDSGSPAADVMAPPDQAQAAPAPAPQAAMPPSPDQGGPVPAPQVQQDNPNTHGWRAVLKGALSGLENHLKGAGEGFLTGGVPGAVAGAVAPGLANEGFQRQRQLAQSNLQQKQSNIQFTDAEAALTLANAHHIDEVRQQMPEQLRLEQEKIDNGFAEKLIAAGIMPTVADKTPGGPMRAIQDIQAGSPDGKVGPQLVLNVGGAHLSFDLNAAANTNANLEQVNVLQALRGMPQYNLGSLNKAPNKSKLTQDAATIYNPPVKNADEAQQTIARLGNYLDNADRAPDSLLPNKEDVKARLKQSIKGIASAYNIRLNDNMKLANARGASSQGAKPTNATDSNGNPVIVSGAEAIKNRMAPATSGAEFQKDYIKPAQDAETAFQMFNQAYADYKAGAKTGAPSMLALSQHLSTTFGNVKGSRITKDMIAEHLNARSISDKAVVAVQKFTNGDVLSPDQWDAFRGLIGQARVQSWGKAIREGGARGFDIQGRVPSDLGGKGGAAPAAGGTHKDPLGLR